MFSGIQPSGRSHLGTYLGALKNWVSMQDGHDCLFCIVDLHALTVPQDPKVLRANVREMAALYVAVGLDPEKSVIFRQSRVSGHGVGLYDYPVLQAADVLLYNAHLVPVGEDQRQHLELMRTLARRFNGLYGETFVVPEPMILDVGARVMALDDPTSKMSKSAPTPAGYVELLDEPDVIRRKIRRAKTDSGSEVLASPEKPAITNLLNIYAGLTGHPVSEIEARYEGKGYGDFKKDLGEVVVERLSPIRRRALELLGDPKELDDLLESGAERAREIAHATLGEAQTRMGLD